MQDRSYQAQNLSSLSLIYHVTPHHIRKGRHPDDQQKRKGRGRKEGGKKGERERKRKEGKNSGRREESGRRGITAG